VSRRSDPKGFIACIPQQIDPSWHEEWGPKLSGLSLNIAYARKRNSGSNLESAFYWLDPGTYREDSGQREMCYFTKRPNGYAFGSSTTGIAVIGRPKNSGETR
jgi:hypothetical protein